MPLKVTKDFIHVPSGEPDSGFQKGFGRVIIVDKARGIKGTLRKLKGSGKTRISSYMFPTGKFTKASAQAWVKAHKEEVDMETNLQFLDPVKKRWPLTYPEIFETLIAFNNGDIYEDYSEYGGWDRVSTYGRKLARKLTQMVNNATVDDEYDEEGNPTNSFRRNDGGTKTMYKFHDGQVIVVNSKNSSDNEMEWEYHENVDGESDIMFSGEETDSYGNMVKAMRNKKKMSRKDMASMMSMSMARLAEIEDGDDPDEDEIGEIAGALGMSKKKMKKMITTAIPPSETQNTGTEEFIEIIDEEFEITDEEIEFQVEEEFEIAEELEEKKQIVFESVGLYEIDNKQVESHRLCGEIIMEEMRQDGTCRFTVPIININQYTANGNKYSQGCAEELIHDINKLHESQRETPLERRSCLDIRIPPKVAESLMEETFDMMPTHGPRISSAYGNPLTSKAGKIVGGYIDYGKKIAYAIGETIRTQAGKDMTVLIEEKMVKGVSLVAIPKVFESNGKGPDKKGLDVDRFEFKGGDFTDNPAMPFPDFSEKETFFELVK